MLKYFKTLHKVEGTSSTVAINPNQVIAVYETLFPVGGEQQEGVEPTMAKATLIMTVQGNQIAVEDEYIEVVAKLNEQ
jgi:hypothetical protein